MLSLNNSSPCTVHTQEFGLAIGKVAIEQRSYATVKLMNCGLHGSSSRNCGLSACRVGDKFTSMATQPARQRFAEEPNGRSTT